MNKVSSFRFFCFFVCFLGLEVRGVRAAGWEKWEGCRLATSEYHDGDSFHVVKQGKDKIFRLYAVDTAETSDEFPGRVEEQAEYFCDRAADILAAGKQADEFTRRLLLKPFTVETCWIDAKGSSRQQRFFGKITLADGSDLGLRLVEAGLARSYGLRQGLQNSYLAKLDRAEAAAKAARRGVWGGKAADLPADDEAEKAEPEPQRDTEFMDTRSMFNALQREAATGAE